MIPECERGSQSRVLTGTLQDLCQMLDYTGKEDTRVKVQNVSHNGAEGGGGRVIGERCGL